ncbi:MAG: phosphoadenosine phosphosulfate reductase [Fastidiosipilaceae bacterium]
MKHYNRNKNVYEAAVERFEIIYSEFDRVCVSFSNGKDSGVILNLAIETARRLNKLPVYALYIDMEAQYAHSIEYTERMFNREDVKAYWVCLPIHLRNAVSQFQPHWVCWDIKKKDAWVRNMPTHPAVISDVKHFPFFRYGMEFEEFVPEFAHWFSQGKKTASIVGIRSDESLNRFRTIKSESKITYKDYSWTTKLFREDSESNIYNAYPIYDWRVEDIWIANGKFGWDYNQIYDLMYMAGVSLHKQRLCQPYGDDQRQGLYLFKALEPETWAKLVNRVEGANFGNRYTETNHTTLGNYKVNLPPGHTFESYAKFLLKTMPPYLAEHYQKKIDTFLSWWDKEGVSIIPDTADPKMEAARKAPSWRRICKVLLKNDYWCKGLSFAQTKKELEKQVEIITKYSNIL